jgi:glycosyltransferase involved in cell wall biosynthesis
MASFPLVSILIPAYNAEAWISDTLRSAVEQSWPNKEIIVVDDGSRDRTPEVAERFISKGVRVIHQSNQGAAAARNQAYSSSKGEYIQWLDADDLLSPDKVTRQMVAAQANGPRALISSEWASFMHRPSRAKFSPSPLWSNLTPLEWMLRKWEGNDHMQTATWLVSRELTEAAGPWDTRLLGDDDGEYFSRVIKASVGVAFVPDARVYYRITGASRLSYIGRSNKKIDAQFLGMKLQIGYLRSLADDARVRAACVHYLQTWLVHFYPERPDIVEQVRELAATLGGKITLPQLSWKYAWIQCLFGYQVAKNAQVAYNRRKIAVRTGWDKLMVRFDRTEGSAA